MTAMSGTPRDPGTLYDRIVFNRRLLGAAHVLVGLVSVSYFVSILEPARYSYWNHGEVKEVGLILIALPVIAPYAISGIYSWQIVASRRLGVALFLVVLVAGAVLMGLLLSGRLGSKIESLELLGAAAAQVGVYMWTADMLLRDESRDAKAVHGSSRN
jgi:hypothetical protein